MGGRVRRQIHRHGEKCPWRRACRLQHESFDRLDTQRLLRDRWSRFRIPHRLRYRRRTVSHILGCGRQRFIDSWSIVRRPQTRRSLVFVRESLARRISRRHGAAGRPRRLSRARTRHHRPRYLESARREVVIRAKTREAGPVTKKSAVDTAPSRTTSRCALFPSVPYVRSSRKESIDLVELSGNCPPSPKSRTAAFSRLSFEFVLDRRASRNRTHPDRSF